MGNKFPSEQFINNDNFKFPSNYESKINLNIKILLIFLYQI